MQRFKYLMFFVLSVLFLGCQNEDLTSKVTITLSSNMIQMTVGDMQTLTATVSNKQAVTWTSSDPTVASVFEGYVEAKGIGMAVITGSVDGASAECKVYVLGKNNETLSLLPEYIEINKSESYQMKYHSVYDVSLTWTSSDTNVALVSATGLVTACKGGTALISLSNGAEEVTARVVVPHTWSEYELVWEDNFDGETLNPDYWNVEVIASPPNTELQYYTDREENVRVENGNLILEAKKEVYGTRQYTSGRINSKGKKSFKYGKIEASISFPSGGGTWPAFWMLGESRRWPSCGEIDIIEHVGNNPRMLSFAIHTSEKNGVNGRNWNSKVYFDNVENQYHTYGIEWRQEDFQGRDRIIFTYDGQECSTVMEDELHIDDDYYWPFNQPHYIILNLALGGLMGGTIDDTIFDNPVEMKVDWVRVYQRSEIE